MDPFVAISERLKHDNKPILKLNYLQKLIKESIDKKVQDGVYNFESYSCPICNSNIFINISNKDRYGIYMPVSICQHCGLLQTNPYMDSDSLTSFYNEEYRKLYSGMEKPTYDFFIEQEKRGARIFQYIKSIGINYNNVLEVGCGAGGILNYFRNFGSNVLGLDIAKEYLDYGINNYKLPLESRSILPKDKKFKPTLIIYSHVLEHIKDIGAELSKLYNICDKDSRIYIEVPGVKYIHVSYESDIGKYLQNAHIYHFSLSSLCNIMKKYGFTLIEGDESVKAIFKKNKVGRSNYTSDYKGVSEYLTFLEKQFKSPIPLFNKIRNTPKSIVLFILKKIKLYNIFIKLAYRIK